MTKLSDQKLLSGRTNVVGPLVVHANIDVLNPTDFEGALAYSADGALYFSDGLSWIASDLPPIKKPAAIDPANSLQNLQLRLSKFLAASGFAFTQTGVRFVASLNADLTNPFLDTVITSTSQSMFTLNVGMAGGPVYGQTFYWRGRYLSQDGQVSAYSSRQTLSFPLLIDKPVSTVIPAQESGQAAVTPFFSAFGRVFAQTQWELYSNAQGTGTPQATVNGASSLSALGLTDVSAPYSWRARYRDTQGTLSDWSAVQSNIQPNLIDNPTPLIGDGVETLVLSISPYRSQIGRPFSKTVWQIFSTSNVSGTPLLVVENGNSALNTREYQSTLLVGTAYYWRARYQDVFGYTTAWTALRSYVLPKLIDDAVATTQANIESRFLELGNYFSAYDIAYGQTQWQIFNNPAGTGTPLFAVTNQALALDTLSVTGALSGAGYFWRARFVGVGGQLSAYSAAQSYIQPLAIAQPILITAAEVVTAELAVYGYASLRNSAFASTSWEIYSNAAGTGLPLATRITTTLTLSTRGLLANGDTGYWRARFQDEFGDKSSWSPIRAYVQPVTASTPVPVTAVNVVTTTLTVQGFVSPYGTAFANTLWEVYDNDSGSGSLLAARTNTGYVLSTKGLVTDNRTVYWRARFQDAAGTLSAFSAAQAYIQPVAVTAPTPVTAANTSATELAVQGYASAYGSAFAGTLWEIYDNALGTGAIVASRTTSGVTLSTLRLAPSRQTYYWRARSADSASGLSAFTTPRAYIQELPISSPTPVTANGATTDTLSISAFVSIYGLLFAESQWEVYTTPEPINTPFATKVVTVGGITLDTGTVTELSGRGGYTYYWRARYKDTTGAYSQWTSMQGFAKTGGVDAPTPITANNAETTSLAISAYSSPPGLVLQDTTWELYTNAAGTGTPFATATNALSTLDLSTVTALVAGSYYWRARYKSTTNQYSSWTPIQGVVIPDLYLRLTYVTDGPSRTVSLILGGTVDAVINWGDGSTQNVNTQGAYSHTYAVANTYTASVSGSVQKFGYFEFGTANSTTNPPPPGYTTNNYDGNTNQVIFFYYLTNQPYLVSCTSFGLLGITNLKYAFNGASYLTIAPATLPPGVTDISFMFSNAVSFNSPINGWNVSAVTTLKQLFNSAYNFNQPLNAWNVSAVTNMDEVFFNTSKFNQPLNAWNVSAVRTMKYMFTGAGQFNQPLNAWNTMNVTNTSYMFTSAYSFNQPIGSWNVSAVTDMSQMFQNASAFNQPIGTWNVAAVTNMQYLFAGAVAFNQPIGAWSISNTLYMTEMCRNVALSTANYDNLLTGWAAQTTKPNVTFGGGNSKYSSTGLTGRNTLTSAPKNWTITDGGLAP